jgi:hypothetical protein
MFRSRCGNEERKARRPGTHDRSWKTPSPYRLLSRRTPAVVLFSSASLGQRICAETLGDGGSVENLEGGLRP